MQLDWLQDDALDWLLADAMAFGEINSTFKAVSRIASISKMASQSFGQSVWCCCFDC
jgi:hypothetical protein